MKHFPIVLACMLAACSSPKLTRQQAVELAKRCTDAGMLPHVHEWMIEGGIASVSCEAFPVGKQ